MNLKPTPAEALSPTADPTTRRTRIARRGGGLALVAAVSLAVCSAAAAGTVAPALQHAAAQTDVQADLPVIVEFANAVDKAALRAEANRIAKATYPDDPKKRKKERRKLLRKMLIDALKDQAKDSQKQVKAFLKTHKENRKLTLLWARNSVVGDLPVYLLDELAALPGVETVKLDARLQGPGPSAPPSAPTYWNLDATGVRGLWAMGHAGAGVVVASLDTGVDASHPDIAPKWRGGSNSWLDPSGQHASPADVNGHGTQVMGLMVGGSSIYYQLGMAPDARWIAAKIFDDANQATLSGIHTAFQWLLDPDGNSATDDAPDIVNNSWDLTGTVNRCNQEFAPDLALLADSDIAVAFAGGNYGSSPDSSVSPANDPSVLAVGSIDSTLGIDAQSGRGAGACDGGIYPQLVAPGESVLTADRMPLTYGFVSGTSFAVAHVSGAMAVLKGAFADASAAQLRAALIGSALDLGEPGPDHNYGYGLLNLAAAHDRLAAELGGGPGNGGGDPGSLQLDAGAYSLDENVATLTVKVSRTGGSAGDVSVDYATSDGSATAGADYVAASGTLNLADGEVSASFAIEVLDDSLVEGDEDLTVSLSNAVGATLGGTALARIAILDDDALDTDGDGVSDALDLCPNTPAGEPVDAAGCSASQLDADGDGVKDARDQCPNTPTGDSVDANGCAPSQLDSDGDGVSDALDGCPGTPLGTAVDALGCPAGSVDADGDGFAADQDCNDGDATVYPGAPEIQRDGIDQDCNGVDLTIDVTRARYVAKQDKLVIWATSSFDAGAALRATVGLQGGGKVDRALSWNKSQGRWQNTLTSFSGKFGSAPSSVSVYGPEGEVTVSVELR